MVSSAPLQNEGQTDHLSGVPALKKASKRYHESVLLSERTSPAVEVAGHFNVRKVLCRKIPQKRTSIAVGVLY